MLKKRRIISLLMVVLLVITSLFTVPSKSSHADGYTPVLPKTCATTEVIVLDMTKDTAVDSDTYRDLQYVYLTIQGIVNRTSSVKIYFNNYGAGYVGTGTWALKNFPETQYNLDDGLVPVTHTTPTLDQNSTYPVLKYLLQNYSSFILGKVRIPSFAANNDSAVMAGLTACAIENAIPVSDAADAVVTGLGYSFTQKADTRSMNSTDAFNWAKNNYFKDETNRKVIGYCAPSRDNVTFSCLDYLIANKAFIYGLDLTVSSNQTLAATVINSTNYALGTTVMTMHEAFDIYSYHYAQGYPIEICLAANYSVHSSFTSSSSIITAPPATQAAVVDNNTVYVAFMVTDGDSSRYGSLFHYDYQRNSGNYCSHGRNLPIGFTYTATAFDLYPNMLKWKSENTNNGKWEYIADSFHGDGVPGTTQQATDNFVANYKNYIDNTNGLFKGVNFFNSSDKEKQAASNIGLDFHVRQYCGNETTTPDWQYNYNVPSVQLVAGTQNSTATNDIQAIRYAVNTVPSGQPAFVLSTISDGGDFITHNCAHCPFKISSDIATDLNASHPNGRNVVYLKPSELFATWKAYMGYSATPTPTPTVTPISQGKAVVSSSVEVPGASDASFAVDGNMNTRWASGHSGSPEWIYVDLGQSTSINMVELNWEVAHSTAYKIQTSNDASTWTNIYSTTAGLGGNEVLNISGTGRYIRMYSTEWSIGNSLWEYKVYAASGTPTPTPTPTGTQVTVEDTDASVIYTGTWSTHSGGWHESNTANSTANLTFTGTDVSVVGCKADWGGTGDVYIDNVFQQTVSFNTSSGTQTTVFTKSGLTNGSHTIKLVEISGWNYVDKFIYTTGGGSTPTPTPTSVLLSQGKIVTVDSADTYDVKTYAVDGNTGTTFSTTDTAYPHWIYVDLGATKTISQVKIYWREQATSYKIQTSANATTWTDIYSTTSGEGGTETFNVSGSGRYVRLYATAGIYNSMKMYEFQVYGN